MTTVVCLTIKKTSRKLHGVQLVDITLDRFTDLEFSFILGNKTNSSKLVDVNGKFFCSNFLAYMKG